MTQRAEIMIERVERESLNYNEHGRYRRKSHRNFGCTRSVRIYTDGYVIKVNKSRWQDGEGNCAAEWEFYTSTTDTIRERLAKPLYISANGQAIAMELLTPTDESPIDCDRQHDDRAVVRSLFMRELGEDAGRFLLGDDGLFNFGYRSDGILVLMDYGHLPSYAGDEKNRCLDFRQKLRLHMGCVSL